MTFTKLTFLPGEMVVVANVDKNVGIVLGIYDDPDGLTWNKRVIVMNSRNLRIEHWPYHWVVKP